MPITTPKALLDTLRKLHTEVRKCPKCNKNLVYFGAGIWWHSLTLSERCPEDK